MVGVATVAAALSIPAAGANQQLYDNAQLASEQAAEQLGAGPVRHSARTSRNLNRPSTPPAASPTANQTLSNPPARVLRGAPPAVRLTGQPNPDAARTAPNPRPTPTSTPTSQQPSATPPTSASTDRSQQTVPSGTESAEISGARCESGSGVENGLADNAIAVHRAVCHRWPSITSYGGLRSGDGGEHGSGHAIDIMNSGETGWQVARWLRANAGRLGITEVIHSQQIWTSERGGDGWRSMSDRGSTTANHYDHVHVTVS